MATYQDKLDRIVASLTSRTGLSNIVPGSIAGQLAEAVAYEQMSLEQILEDDAASNSLLLATGDALDTIGNGFFGISRRQEISTAVTPSMKVLKFYVKTKTFGDYNGNQNIVVPQGTILEGTLGLQVVRLRLTSDVTLLASESEKYVGAELIQGPNDVLPAGTINKHYFTKYAAALSNALLVTNTSVIATGRPKESDDNYRFRIVNSLSAFTRTNTMGIQETVTSVPGVSYTVIDQSSRGGGTFTVFVQGVSPITSDELISDVEFALQDQLSPWVSYKVAKMNYIGAQMVINVTTNNPSYYVGNTSFTSQLQEVISSYVNNYIDSEFKYNSILSLLKDYNSDITSATFSSLKQYTGVGINRSFNEIDLTLNPDPVVYIDQIEKLVIEPIPYAILIMVS